MGLSLFALSGGLVIAAVLTTATYRYFYIGINSMVPEVFGSIMLIVIFSAAIWFSAFVQKAVHVRVLDVASDKTNSIVGAALGVAKFFIIGAVFSVAIFYLNCKGNFLPERDAKSYIMNFSKDAMLTTVKMLKMDAHFYDDDPCSSKYKKYLREQQQQQNQNSDNNTDSVDNNNNSNDSSSDNNTNNTTNQNNSDQNNNTDNNQHPIVDDLDNP